MVTVFDIITIWPEPTKPGVGRRKEGRVLFHKEVPDANFIHPHITGITFGNSREAKLLEP